MARNNVPPELVARFERALKIDACPGSPAPDRGHSQRLGGRVCRKPAAARFLAPRHRRQADSVARDRGTDLDGFGIVAAGDGEAHKVPLTMLDRADLADIADDAGEQ